ncbi:MAG: sugar phosphate isomerase/epimerase family protein [Candidatus Hydrogenedentota bacterium]
MAMSRRGFLKHTLVSVGAAAALPRMAAGAPPGIRLSACDWSLSAKGPEGLQKAKAAGLAGLEISAGGPADSITLADPKVRTAYKKQMAETGIAVSSVAMGFLNGAPLATDPRGPKWLEQTIDAAADLETKVVLLAFFGNGDLRDKRGALKPGAVDAVVQRVKNAAPHAAEKGVILGLENTLSGAQNLAILERIGSDAVQVYYDVGNSTYNGYDVPAELRALDKRICQIHFKDGKHYLGQGRVDMQPVAKAMADIGYDGWVVLETACPGGDSVADFQRNAKFTRALLKRNA